MALQPDDFKCALITGGGGGLGKAMAKHFLSDNKKVIIVGRTESNLQSTSKELGNIPYYVLDTGKVNDVPGFVKKVISEHPEVDCLINNAGVQRPLDVEEMSADEFLTKADQEIDINIRGPMHLALHFLPHFKSKPSAVIVNVSSLLGFLPMSIINPNYNGTKAWVHMFSMNLRTQLKNSNVKVIEIAPPAVTTDLHREREDPKDNTKDKNPVALDIDEFIADMAKEIKAGKTTIGAGPSIDIIEKWMKEYNEPYQKAANAWKS